MARPCGPERLRAGRSLLHEAPDRGSYRDDDFRRYSRRLVRRLRVSAQPADSLRLARLVFHRGVSKWVGTLGFFVPAANNLEQGPQGAPPDPLLVPTRAMLVC